MPSLEKMGEGTAFRGCGKTQQGLSVIRQRTNLDSKQDRAVVTANDRSRGGEAGVPACLKPPTALPGG